MILYHCSYIHRTGEICGRGSKSERCYIHRNSPMPTPCRDCVVSQIGLNIMHAINM